jgi:hypothetical protein
MIIAVADNVIALKNLQRKDRNPKEQGNIRNTANGIRGMYRTARASTAAIGRGRACRNSGLACLA